MKILLLGEYSGFHQNLRDGLREIGHDTIVAGLKDGKKKIPVDIDFDAKFGGLTGKLERIAKSIIFSMGAKNYDIVQFINPHIFPRGLKLNNYLIKQIINNNSKCFLSSCGDDAFFVMRGAKQLDHNPHLDALKYDLKMAVHPVDNEAAYKWNDELSDLVTGIIPVVYEYLLGYQGKMNVSQCIPLPINTQKISYQDNIFKDKITIFHGLNRYGFKGTRHIEAAFKILTEKYPNDVECIIDGGMPIAEYLELMRKVNVVVDQTYSYSLGMNALYAMAMGKIVLGGARKESLDALGIQSSPAINIEPDPEHIVKQIESLIENKEKIGSLGFESRKFVENVHDHKKVAMQYIETWNKFSGDEE